MILKPRKTSVLNQISRHFEDLALAIVIWLCTLPLIGLLVFPLFGLKVTLLVAAVLLIFILVVCWGICSWKIFHS